MKFKRRWTETESGFRLAALKFQLLSSFTRLIQITVKHQETESGFRLKRLKFRLLSSFTRLN
ncbi:hypothetical protein LBU01_04640 [Lentilactobacillus buchneri]|nr:hypothetical protein LBU01_04640 [Lentilactobacillus buchneri]